MGPGLDGGAGELIIVAVRSPLRQAESMPEPMPESLTITVAPSVARSGTDLILVFDGGCPFCRHFAELSELRSGIPALQIRDGRSEHRLRRELLQRGFPLADGAILLEGDRVFHGAAAIERLCTLMKPSAALLQLLAPLMGTPRRSAGLYPLLLLGRRIALALRGLPVDPDAPSEADRFRG